MADWYQLYLDDLPIWGMVGELATPELPEGSPVPADGDGEPLLYTHKKFVIAYNKNKSARIGVIASHPAVRAPPTPDECNA